MFSQLKAGHWRFSKRPNIGLQFSKLGPWRRSWGHPGHLGVGLVIGQFRMSLERVGCGGFKLTYIYIYTYNTFV